MSMDMGQKIGPMPLGAWVAAVGGGIGLLYWQRKNAAASATSSTATAAPNANALLGDTVGTGAPTDWTAVVPPTTDPSSTSGSSITTNDEWANAAITYLIAQGIEPTLADAAIRNYINGQNITTQQQGIVDIALKHLGATPTTLSPPITNPTPISNPIPAPIPVPVVKPPVVVKPAPVPVSHPTPGRTARFVTVTPWPGTKYDSLYKIAAAYYGNGNRYVDIFNANKVGVRRPDGSMGWMTNPSLIYPGRTLYIP